MIAPHGVIMIHAGISHQTRKMNDFLQWNYISGGKLGCVGECALILHPPSNQGRSQWGGGWGAAEHLSENFALLSEFCVLNN